MVEFFYQVKGSARDYYSTRESIVSVTIENYNAFANVIEDDGTLLCEPCVVNNIDPFEDAEGKTWDAAVLDSVSNYHVYPMSDRAACENCQSVPRDMLYKIFKFVPED